MPVTLQVTSGPSAGKKIYVARGQIVRVGRTEWADFGFPGDAEMADVHFAVQADGDECLIKDASGGVGTNLNGSPVQESPLHSGDVVTAGQTEFSVTVEGEDVVVRQGGTLNAEAIGRSESDALTAAKLCQSLKMSDGARELLVEGLMPPDYLAILIEGKHYSDALRFLALWLPRPAAIDWGCACVESAFAGHLATDDASALEAARRWSKEPNQANCRVAEAAAQRSNFSGAASWMALASFWSGDSLAPVDAPPVAPGLGLAAEAITGAITLAATHSDPAKAGERYLEFLEAGRSRIGDASLKSPTS